MNNEEKQRATEEFLVQSGWNTDSAKKAAQKSIDEGEPLLETLCLHKLVESCLAYVHDSSWVKNRAKSADAGEGHDIVKRLVDSGASADDLARFARLMQRQLLGDLGCILDGAGLWPTPDLPYTDFRIFAVSELDSPIHCKPEAQIQELHESLGFSGDWEMEIKLSREAAEAWKRKVDEERQRRGLTKGDS